MSTSVTLPALGESVTEGTVSRWLKQVGDQVEADEPLLEVSTDKVDTEIPSPTSGVLLEIRAEEDETVAVGALLEVSTDKVDTEIPSPASGSLLEIRVQEDETVAVGAVLAVVGEAQDAGGGDSGGSAPAAEAEPEARLEPGTDG